MFASKLNTKQIKVQGFVNNGKAIVPCSMAALFTSDKIGETLSIAGGNKLIFTVPFKPVIELTQQARASNK